VKTFLGGGFVQRSHAFPFVHGAATYCVMAVVRRLRSLARSC